MSRSKTKAQIQTIPFSQLVEIYKGYSQERLDEEIAALFELCHAILEATECDSLESYPTTNVMLKISCDVLKDGSRYYN